MELLSTLFIVLCVLAVFVFGFFLGKYKADKTTIDDKLEEFYRRLLEEIKKHR